MPGRPPALARAIEKISAKTPIGSRLRSEEWFDVPVSVRERSFFSARVESVRLLSHMKRRLESELRMLREQTPKGPAVFDRSSFIDAVREDAEALGVKIPPGKEGTIEDITSIPRLGLIYDTQKRMAQGYASHKAGMSRGALLLFPAQRFIRIRRSVEPRDWATRWEEAANTVGWLGVARGPYVALKTSPLWAALSAFGTPWPPFDFNSGMGLEDVDRDEAVSLGLLQQTEILGAPEKDFNEGVQASTRGVDPDVLTKALEKSTGDLEQQADRITMRTRLTLDRASKALEKQRFELLGAKPWAPGDKTTVYRVRDSRTGAISEMTAKQIQRLLAL